MIADDNHTAGYRSNLQFLTAKCIDLSLIIYYSTNFKDVLNPILLLSIQYTIYSRVRVRLVEVFAE